MKKKITALLLSILMIASCFLMTACSDEEDTDGPETTTRTPVSLNFYIITDDSTTEKGIKDMQAAFNEYTEANFTTHVEFTMVKASEYEAILDAKFKSVASAKKTTVSTEIQYYVDDLGMTRIKYPDIQEDQLDIILITSKDMFMNYVKQDRLMQLDKATTNVYPGLLSHFSNSVVTASKVNNALYAIPNYHVMGEYTYMVVSRDAAKSVWLDSINEQYKFDTTKSLNNTYNGYLSFLTLADKLSEKEITPFASEFDYPNYESYSTDGSPSLIGRDPDQSTANYSFMLDNNAYFSEYWQLMVEARAKNYFSSESTDVGLYDSDSNPGGYAMKVVKGDYATRYDYADEIVKVIGKPTFSSDDVFSSMFAISKYTKNFDRSMEIINALTTNAELHNILQYGKEKVHYEKTASNTVTLLPGADGSVYSMNTKHTGNFFLTYPCEDIGLDPDEKVTLANGNSEYAYIHYGKIQNSECVTTVTASWLDKLKAIEAGQKVYTASSYSFKKIEGASEDSEYTYTKLTELLDAVNASMSGFYTDIAAATTKEDVLTIIDSYKTTYNSFKYRKNFTDNLAAFLKAL